MKEIFEEGRECVFILSPEMREREARCTKWDISSFCICYIAVLTFATHCVSVRLIQPNRILMWGSGNIIHVLASCRSTSHILFCSRLVLVLFLSCSRFVPDSKDWDKILLPCLVPVPCYRFVLVLFLSCSLLVPVLFLFGNAITPPRERPGGARAI